jgi:hypothetical protein
MSVTFNGDSIVVAGACGVEEAEQLVSLVQTHPAAIVDLSTAESLHTALWQALFALSPVIAGEPDDKFARGWIMPLLAARRCDAAS